MSKGASTSEVESLLGIHLSLLEGLHKYRVHSGPSSFRQISGAAVSVSRGGKISHGSLRMLWITTSLALSFCSPLSLPSRMGWEHFPLFE